MQKIFRARLPRACLIALMWPALTVAQESVPDTGRRMAEAIEDCALVREGVARLACYDSFNNPAKARDKASDQQLQEAGKMADGLAPDPESGQQAAERAGDGSADENVMMKMVDRSLKAEKALFSFSGSFIGYRPTYLMPITWTDDPNTAPTSPRLGTTGYDYDLEKEEAKYQISFKVPLLTGMLDDRTTLWFGYTQRSFWQVYNQDESAPFRETNYEPEIFLRHRADWNLGAVSLTALKFGVNHQSNGQSEPRSRSWNRVMASAGFTHGRWLFVVEPWYRIPETSEDDNADIERYLGHGSLNVVYKRAEDRTFSLKLMNNLRSDNHTSLEFGYSFPIGDTIKGFFQYYNGYGESLIDYNRRIERFGLGIMLNDWL
ncbi:phospholipase [Streptosporangium jomthongense]|uniref:Phospholipase A1 n=1 Tax=Marinobacter aromaticivorans TaxID=1494078 RepID=A0ABW2IUL2_9GAMM|nr:phospholipase A [Marinobacter aromaticivorans]GGE66415.1 phospholipase [Streptosporangium jomthongense]